MPEDYSQRCKGEWYWLRRSQFGHKLTFRCDRSGAPRR